MSFIQPAKFDFNVWSAKRLLPFMMRLSQIVSSGKFLALFNSEFLLNLRKFSAALIADCWYLSDYSFKHILLWCFKKRKYQNSQSICFDFWSDFICFNYFWWRIRHTGLSIRCKWYFCDGRCYGTVFCHYF